MISLALLILFGCGGDTSTAENDADPNTIDGAGVDGTDGTGNANSCGVIPDNQTPPTGAALPLTVGSDPPPFAVPNGTTFSANLAYDTHTRAAFDVFLPSSATATPVVFYFHAGGFITGDKAAAPTGYEGSFKAGVQGLLASGIAVVAPNYRFVDSADNSDGVHTSLQDIKRAVQYARYHADTLNVDPTRVGVVGGSAGGGASLWLALHNDMKELSSNDPVSRMSSRVQAAVAYDAQASYDLLTWEEVFSSDGFSLESTYNSDPVERAAINEFYQISSFSDMQSTRLKTQRADMDFLKMADECDPPIQVVNNAPEPSFQPKQQVLNHHPKHMRAIYDAARAANAPTIQASLKKSYDIEDPKPFPDAVSFFVSSL